ncbi:signal transduction histidine kinase/CheY-like chemotaxis protein/ligand-binding sensor domain-containing protein/HPt (histidine-containing phosphotransfer) domain-containing protein [Duganella sp. SG902]|uniref:two-component regulator propeller domain-containing protein n=1 Tax=Duganella sp. SG902 TaxID=2587016 RepID=UPI00159D26CA|nr:two-component regulator propeller domain-containing protein [Duganella sp. SG902]NVM77545.1 signal transduction histidine kinase/CheY-like chemotaxis protein/ligand-binding sensor domain-containing protein/HPt (histidine-containing phosphotransfer) domain-containing protein [Duganella sp. SG902]
MAAWIHNRWWTRAWPGLLTACAVALAGPAAAGPPEAGADGWSRLAQPVFQNYGAQNGLSNPVTTDIAQDQAGFLWVGTQGGLSRWDGYRFRNYTSVAGDSRSLPDNFIVAVHVDQRGLLWVGTVNGGLARYRPETDDFVTYHSKNSALSPGGVRAIAGDGADGLWIGTDRGLDHMAGVAEPARARITHYRHDDANPGSPPGDAVKAVYLDPRGTLWVATLKGLVWRARGAAGFVQLPLPDGAVASALFMDSAGRLWIGTRDRGVFVLPPGGAAAARYADSAEAATLMKNEIITGISEAAGGDIWISSFAGGVAIVDPASGRLRRATFDGQAPGGFASGMLRALLTDRAGSIWLATDSGLSRSEPLPAVMSLGQRRDDRPGLSDLYYNALALTPGGEIWAASVRHGADLIDPRRGTAAGWQPRRRRDDDPGPATHVSTLLAGADGVVWVATSAGLYRSGPGGRDAVRVAAPWLERLRLRALAEDGDLLWIGTATEGVYLARRDGRGGLEKVRHVEGLSGMDVTTLHRAPDGTMWVGTRTGLNRVDRASGAVLERILGDPLDPAALSNAYVNTLHTDRRGRLWVGSNGGIDVMEGGGSGARRFRRLGAAQGMPNINTGTLLADRQGRVWCSTDDGIVVIDPDTLAIGVLGRADGVRYSPYWSHAGVATASGELVFGGSGGLTIVHPERYRPWRLDAPLVVTELRLGGQPVPPGGRHDAAAPLLVRAEANSFAVEFAALDFTAPERNRYAYRLEGFDRDWIAADAAHRVASYTNLPPGRYRLAIRGSNRSGAWSTQTLDLAVTVLPWWYQTWWFRAAMALLTAGALYGAYRLRTWRLAAQRGALEREVALRTAEVLQQKALAEQQRGEAEREHRLASERNAELAEVNRLAHTLAGKLDLDTLIALVGDQVHRMFDAGGTEITLLERDSGALEVPYAAGAPARPGLHDAGRGARVIGAGRGELAPAELCVPIIANGVALGALTVRRGGGAPAYRASDQRLLETIASHLGAALQNALLFRQAEAARARAEEATQAKSMFLANMSHEIRTPMNAVIGLSYLALNAESAGGQREQLQKIHQAGTSLLGIVSGILDFSKIEAGKVEIETADFDLDELLAHVAAVGGGGRGGPLECNFVVPAEVPRRLRGDALRLGQVLINLVNNALKFTARGEVVLTVRRLERGPGRSRLAFSVRDTGIGMSADVLGRLFQPFSQADSSSTRKFGGTGLGLSICKNLVELMGGTIRAESQAGAGSCFTIELSLEHAADQPARPLPAALNGLRVLVVDDNAAARAALRGALEHLGIAVVAAASPADALAEVRDAAAPFDLLLAGARRPGPALIRHLYAGDAGRPRFALLTAGATQAADEAALAAGVDAMLAKPVTRGSLLATLTRLFAPAPADDGAREAVPQFKGARVLLAEDNAINQEIAVGMLRACGIEVEVAGSGRIAIERLRAADAPRRYQLVLLDLHMPEIDGHTVALRLRADRRFDALPIIAVTANVLPDERRRCKEAGFNDHLGKPLMPAELYRVLARYLPAATHTAPRGPGAEATPALPDEVAGLDLAHARKSVNGDDALLLKVLRMFLRDERDCGARLRAALAAADHEAAERHAHSLRAVAESLGAARLARLADAFERAARQRPPPEALNGALDALEAALAELCANLERRLPDQALDATAAAARPPAAWLDELRRLDQALRAGGDLAQTLFAACAPEFAATFGAWDAEAIQRCLQRRDIVGAHAALGWVIHKHALDL